MPVYEGVAGGEGEGLGDVLVRSAGEEGRMREGRTTYGVYELLDFLP